MSAVFESNDMENREYVEQTYKNIPTVSNNGSPTIKGKALREDDGATAKGNEASGEDEGAVPREGGYYIKQHELYSNELRRFKVSVDKTIVPESSNFQYMITLKDEVTGATATSSISHLSDAVEELINAGSIVLCRPKESRTLKRVMEAAISEALINFDFTKNSHKALGWKTVSGKEYYLGSNLLEVSTGRMIESKYTAQNVINITCDGCIEDWIDANNKYIAPKVIPSIIMISSFAGMFRQRYKGIAPDTQLVLSITGPSSVGKTTLVRAAHTVYTSEAEYLGYSTSLNSRTKRLALRNPVVASIDDVLQMTSLKDMKPQSINEVIFSLASGISKDRLGQYGEIKPQERFDSTVLLTSVETLLDKTGDVDVGQMSRVIEFEITKDDVADGSNDGEKKKYVAEMIQQLERNHGLAAEEFARELINEEMTVGGYQALMERIQEQYEGIEADVRAKLYAAGLNNTRAANRIALIVLLAQQLNDKMGLHYGKAISGYDDNALNTTDGVERIKEFLINNAVKSQKRLEGILQENMALALIGNYLKSHKQFFHKGIIDNSSGGGNGDENDALQQYLGIWTTDKNGCVVVKIPCGTGYNRFAGMLYGIDPTDIFALEKGDTAKYSSIINIKAVESCARYLKDTGSSTVKSGSLYTKATFVKGAKQIMGYEITLDQGTLSPEILN